MPSQAARSLCSQERAQDFFPQPEAQGAGEPAAETAGPAVAMPVYCPPSSGDGFVPVIKPALGVLQAFLISIFCCFFATSAGFGRWMCNTPLSNFPSSFGGSGSNGKGIARLTEP